MWRATIHRFGPPPRVRSNPKKPARATRHASTKAELKLRAHSRFSRVPTQGVLPGFPWETQVGRECLERVVNPKNERKEMRNRPIVIACRVTAHERNVLEAAARLARSSLAETVRRNAVQGAVDRLRAVEHEDAKEDAA